MPLFDPPPVLVDLETTGAHPRRDRITEIGIVQSNGVSVRAWRTPVNPAQPIPPFIQRRTGIDAAMVTAAPTCEALAPARFAGAIALRDRSTRQSGHPWHHFDHGCHVGDCPHPTARQALGACCGNG